MFAVYFRLTIILMSLIATPTETGYYATAFRVLEVLLLLPGLLVGTMLPILARAARDDRSRHRYALERLYEATVVIGGLITIMVALGAPLAMEILTGHSKSPSVVVLQIQSVALGASFVGASWQYGLLSLGKYRTLLISSFLPLIVSCTLTLTLVPGLGARGGAIAVTGGEMVLLALGYLFIQRADPELRFAPGVLVKVGLVGGLAACLLLVPGLSSIVRVAIGTVVYALGVVVLKAIPPEIAQAMRPGRGARHEPAG
jgi:O-antigen/teichoic acid export membrane protein